MRSVKAVKCAFFLLVCSISLIRLSDATYELPFTHKFSGKAREDHYAQQRGDWPFPDVDTVDYQKFLTHHDAARHGRMLANIPASYTFLEGNYSIQFVGGLYYSTIDVGTPSVPFLVALDTGSDLFWLPCECQSCAPTSSPIYEDYGITNALNVYSPTDSNTSKTIACASDECHLYINQCDANGGGECLYKVNYASVNTSTSGRLVEDVIHLIPNDGEPTPTTVPIVLGCGQMQTGSFIDGYGAPDGLIGLGFQNYSVPALLANSGLVKDSFSMCFGPDFSGRVVFGDIGSATQTSTPFLRVQPGSYDTYFVGVEAIDVGTDSITVGEPALFDTGTTYSYLNSSTYQQLLTSFDKQNTDYTRIPVGSEEIQPWELCYLTTDAIIKTPSIDYVLNGKVPFSVKFPFVPLIYQNRTRAGFCLAIFESNANIIGVNFMVGLNLIFNREERTLGFEETDCSSLQANSGAGPAPESGGPVTGPKAPTPSPSRRPPPSSNTTPGPGASPAPSGASNIAAFSLATGLALAIVHILL